MSNADFPPSDSFQGADETVFSQGLDRRRVIKFGTVATGAAFLTPTLLTLGASPASASGDGATKYATASDTEGTAPSYAAGRTVSFSVDGPGLWVFAFFVRGNDDGSSTGPITISTPTAAGGWTELASQTGTDTGSDLNNRITMRAFSGYVDPSEFADPYTVTLRYSNLGGGSPGLLRLGCGYNFPTATSATSAQLSAVGSPSIAASTATAPGSRFLLLTGGVNDLTLGSNAPTGYSGTNSSLATTRTPPGTMAGGAYLSTAKVNGGTTSGAVTASWTTLPKTQVSMLLAIG